MQRPTRERAYLGAVLTLGLLGCLAYASVELFFLDGNLGFPLDDSWIHLQFARNLANGEGLTYNPGELVAELDLSNVGAHLAARIAALVPAWHEHAACRDVDTAVFFPGVGQSTKPAIAICERCPVKRACLDEALADPDLDHGIRGGYSAEARKAERRTGRILPRD